MERKKNKNIKTKNKRLLEKKKRDKEEEREELFEKLSLKIDYSKEEIAEEHAQFMKKYPKGRMSKHEFMKDSKQFLNEKTQFLGASLFRVFDEDNSGSIDFYEFMMVANCTKLNSLEDKLTWIFDVFDVDGGGTIDVEEVGGIVKALFKMSMLDTDEEVINACIQNVVDALDENDDGEITKEEFIKNSMKVGFLNNIMEQEVNIESQ